MCDDGKTKRTVRYQSQPFLSVGWPNDAAQVENARDLQDWDHFHTAQIATYNLGGDRNDYASMFNKESRDSLWRGPTYIAKKKKKKK
jgi:hypothetical protein